MLASRSQRYTPLRESLSLMEKRPFAPWFKITEPRKNYLTDIPALTLGPASTLGFSLAS